MTVRQLRVRELAEEREESLSPHAAKSRLSRGRLHAEEPCPVRTAFQRDRDRILYSKAFRRLKHKTQVFIAPQGDHYVTRLTHTLEVAQVARTITRALGLNEDLAEAIALGHDLGHTPFGHVGEDVLNELYPPGFRHNEQSLRTVDLLENDGQGLNLTWEVRDGILNHSKSRLSISEEWVRTGTLEGDVCRIADIVAFINHDISDAIRAGMLTETDLPAQATELLGHTGSERINTMVSDIIASSWVVRGPCPTPGIRMSTSVMAAMNVLRDFLFAQVYDRCSAQRKTERAREVVRTLYYHFTAHEEKLPPECQLHNTDGARGAVDYIAGMTDQYARRRSAVLRKIAGNPS